MPQPNQRETQQYAESMHDLRVYLKIKLNLTAIILHLFLRVNQRVTEGIGIGIGRRLEYSVSVSVAKRGIALTLKLIHQKLKKTTRNTNE